MIMSYYTNNYTYTITIRPNLERYPQMHPLWCGVTDCEWIIPGTVSP